jgi:hypothetical protein
MTVAQFRAFQDAHPTEKWQLVDGRLYAMAVGSVEAWSRVEGGFDEQVVKRREDALVIPALGIEIPLAEIYEGVDVEA